MLYPRIVMDTQKLRFNIDKLTGLCHEQGISLAVVTKGICGDARAVSLIDDSDADFIADSRLKNLARMKTKKPRMLIRIPMPCEVDELVKNCEISLESELETLKLIAAEAARANVRHKVILTLDMGDLREGIFFKDTEQIISTARYIASQPSLELYGTGVNLTCFGAILPDEENLGGLVGITEMLRRELNLPIPLISGGNSSTMTMLNTRTVPRGINSLRLGEATLLGSDAGTLLQMPGYMHDCFTIEASLVEVQSKPSVPFGSAGANAFREEVSFTDRGQMRRGILALGRQDTDVSNLVPKDARIEILGSSSDHTIVDLTHTGCDYAIGSIITFDVGYSALLKAYTCEYTEKIYI